MFGMKLWKIFSVGLFLVGGAAGSCLLWPDNLSGRRSVQVMSYNIRYAGLTDGRNSWNNRRKMVASTVLFHQADIIGMQEALERQIRDLAKLLPEFDWVGVGRDDGGRKGEFNPIFYRRERFEILESSTFWLSETPNSPGKKGWDAACARIVTWAKIHHRSTGEIFFCFNTHFDHMGAEARRMSARLVRRELSRIAGEFPLVLTGDFNCSPSDLPYQILTSAFQGRAGFKDAMLFSDSEHYGSLHTYNGFRPERTTGSRIDFIFYRGEVRVLRHAIIAEKWDGRFASDHYPVFAEMEWK